MPTTPRTRRPQPRRHHPTAAHASPHGSALTSSLLRTNASLSAHLLPNFSTLSCSFTPAFAHFLPKEPSHAYTPSPTKPRTNSSNSAHLHQATYAHSRPFRPRKQSRCTERTGCCSHTNKSLLPYCSSVCTMGTERLSHTNKSLLPCCPSVCTEVFGKSL